MQIVWEPTAIHLLKSKHTLLELETFDFKGEPTPVYCVVPAEKIVMEMATLDSYKNLHQEFINAYNAKNYQLCRELMPVLKGKFGGELDTFYEEIAKKIE